MSLSVPAAGTTCGNGPPPPQADTASPTPPSTGEADGSDGVSTFWYWVFGLGFFGLAVAFFATGLVLHRRR